MSDLITATYPATLCEVGYARAAKEGQTWYVVYRPSEDKLGITPKLTSEDEIISTCEPEMLSEQVDV